jgi:RHS repeat-associated protein
VNLQLVDSSLAAFMAKTCRKGTRMINRIVSTVLLLCLCPIAALANHAEDSCPDIHVADGEAIEPVLMENWNVLDSPVVPIKTTLQITGIAETYGYCQTRVWDGTQCIDGARYERGVVKIVPKFSRQVIPFLYDAEDINMNYAFPGCDIWGEDHYVDGRNPGEFCLTNQTNLDWPGRYEFVVQLQSRPTFCLMAPEWTDSEKIEVTAVAELRCVSDSQTNVGNPCNAATGNKHQSEEDVTANGTRLGVTRYYNSLAPIDYGLGPGWRTNWHKRLELLPGGLTARRANGSGEPFTLNGANLESPPDSKLSITADGTGYTLTLSDGATERYNLGGLITSQTDRTGNVTSYGYNASGGLISVTGPFGHTLGFSYDASNRLTSVTEPSGATVQYSFDANSNLATVTRQDGTVRTYHYETTQTWLLTGITDENGDRFSTYGYDSNGKANLTEYAQTTNTVGQEKFTITHGYGGSYALVYDATANREFLSFLWQHGVPKVTQRLNYGDYKSVRRTFDSDNNLLTYTDELNRVTAYTYNATNQRISKTEASGTAEARTTNYEYLSPLEDLVTKTTTPSVATGQNKEVTTAYDSSRNVVSVTIDGFTLGGASISRQTTMSYNGVGQVIGIDGPRTDVTDLTALEYYVCTTGNECGQLMKVTNALGHVTTYDTYDANGRVLQTTGPNDLVTTYSYNARGQVLTITETPLIGAARTTSYAYDNAGQLASVTSPTGSVLTYAYDEALDLRSITDNLGNKIEYTYDSRGNRISEDTRDPQGALTRTIDTIYDKRNRIDVIDSAGSITNVLFDQVGNLVSETDPNSATTTHTYDRLDRLTKTVDALSGSTLYTYDENDNVLSVATPNGATTTFDYDDLGNLLQETSPDRGQTNYTHDAAGNVLTKTDARGKTATYTHDALNRVLTESYTDGELITFSYDTAPNGAGQRASMTDTSGSTSWEYDAFGAVTKSTRVIAGQTLVTQYGYDSAGRMTSMTYPSGKVAAYTWIDDRITGVSFDSTVIFSGATYEPFGPANGWNWGNGGTMSRTFDQRGLPTSHSLGADTRSLVYDAIGQITDLNDTRHNVDFDYDSLGRLISNLKGAGTLAPLPDSQLFTYDSNGNRTSINEDGTPYIYSVQSSSNRLLSTAGPIAKVYTYDLAGNVTADSIHTYSYSDRGRLTSLDSGSVSYSYNGLGQRVSKSDGTMTLFVYDEAGQLIGEYDATGSPLSEHVYFSGAPIALQQGSATYYAHSDHLGSPRVITDSTNTAVWRWESDPFGTTPAQEDPDGDLYLLTYNLRFPGQYIDQETNQRYNYHRTFETSIGRYLESDPIGLEGGLNTYGYALQNPLRYSDPTGENSLVLNGGRLLFTPVPGARIAGGALILAGGAALVYEMCTDDEVDCKKAKDECIEECFKFVGKGGTAYTDCIAKCMDRKGCDQYNPKWKT